MKNIKLYFDLQLDLFEQLSIVSTEVNFSLYHMHNQINIQAQKKHWMTEL